MLFHFPLLDVHGTFHYAPSANSCCCHGIVALTCSSCMSHEVLLCSLASSSAATPATAQLSCALSESESYHRDLTRSQNQKTRPNQPHHAFSSLSFWEASMIYIGTQRERKRSENIGIHWNSSCDTLVGASARLILSNRESEQ